MLSRQYQNETHYQLSEQVSFLLRLGNQRHTSIFQNHIRNELTATQFSTLLRLSERDRVSQNHLGRLVGMDIATAKGVVDRLRTKGLVKSEPDSIDKRRSIISLTTKGICLVAKLKSVGKTITEDTLCPLNEQERTTLLALLKKIS